MMKPLTLIKAEERSLCFEWDFQQKYNGVTYNVLLGIGSGEMSTVAMVEPEEYADPISASYYGDDNKIRYILFSLQPATSYRVKVITGEGWETEEKRFTTIGKAKDGKSSPVKRTTIVKAVPKGVVPVVVTAPRRYGHRHLAKEGYTAPGQNKKSLSQDSKDGPDATSPKMSERQRDAEARKKKKEDEEEAKRNPNKKKEEEDQEESDRYGPKLDKYGYTGRAKIFDDVNGLALSSHPSHTRLGGTRPSLRSTRGDDYDEGSMGRSGNSGGKGKGGKGASGRSGASTQGHSQSPASRDKTKSNTSAATSSRGRAGNNY